MPAIRNIRATARLNPVGTSNSGQQTTDPMTQELLSRRSTPKLSAGKLLLWKVKKAYSAAGLDITDLTINPPLPLSKQEREEQENEQLENGVVQETPATNSNDAPLVACPSCPPPKERMSKGARGKASLEESTEMYCMRGTAKGVLRHISTKTHLEHVARRTGINTDPIWKSFPQCPLCKKHFPRPDGYNKHRKQCEKENRLQTPSIYEATPEPVPSRSREQTPEEPAEFTVPSQPRKGKERAIEEELPEGMKLVVYEADEDPIPESFTSDPALWPALAGPSTSFAGPSSSSAGPSNYTSPLLASSSSTSFAGPSSSSAGPSNYISPLLANSSFPPTDYLGIPEEPWAFDPLLSSSSSSSSSAAPSSSSSPFDPFTPIEDFNLQYPLDEADPATSYIPSYDQSPYSYNNNIDSYFPPMPYHSLHYPTPYKPYARAAWEHMSMSMSMPRNPGMQLSHPSSSSAPDYSYMTDEEFAELLGSTPLSRPYIDSYGNPLALQAQAEPVHWSNSPGASDSLDFPPLDAAVNLEADLDEFDGVWF